MWCRTTKHKCRLLPSTSANWRAPATAKALLPHRPNSAKPSGSTVPAPPPSPSTPTPSKSTKTWSFRWNAWANIRTASSASILSCRFKTNSNSAPRWRIIFQAACRWTKWTPTCPPPNFWANVPNTRSPMSPLCRSAGNGCCTTWTCRWPNTKRVTAKPPMPPPKPTRSRAALLPSAISGYVCP